MKPEELKRTEAFRRSPLGYRADEVDEYIEQVLDAYGQLYRDNLELLMRVKAYTEREAELKSLKAEAGKMLEDARAEAERIVSDGSRKRSELIADGAARGEEALENGRRRADALLQQARRAADLEDDRMRRMEQSVTVFHREMCRHYQEEIDALTALRDRLGDFEPEGFRRTVAKPAPAPGQTSAPSEPAPMQELLDDLSFPMPSTVAEEDFDPEAAAEYSREFTIGSAELPGITPDDDGIVPGRAPKADLFSRVYGNGDSYVEDLRRGGNRK